MTEIVADMRRGRLVFGRLLDALRDKEYPYNKAVLPQRHIPLEMQADPLTHARFLFYLCHYMRGAIKSDLAAQQLVALWKEEPGFFNPIGFSARYSTETVENFLRGVIDYQTKQIASFWIENSNRLETRWKGDPREIFKHARNADVVRERIINHAARKKQPTTHGFQFEQGFLGFQEKMASMLSYFLMDAELVGGNTIAPAVDFHLLRIMIATGVLKIDQQLLGEAFYNEARDTGTAMLERYCKSSNVGTVEIGDALWMLSTSLCNRAPGNASVDRSNKGRGSSKKRNHIPTAQQEFYVGDKTPIKSAEEKREERRSQRKERDGKKVLPKPLQVDPENLSHQIRYQRSCHVCPAEKLCSLNILSGPYYEGGVFVWRKRQRIAHPALDLTVATKQPVEHASTDD